MSIRVTQKVWKPTANYGWTVSPVVYCNPRTCPGPAEVSGCNERGYEIPARSSSRETWTFLLQEYIWKIRVWLLSPVIVKISCYWRNTIYWAPLWISMKVLRNAELQSRQPKLHICDDYQWNCEQNCIPTTHLYYLIFRCTADSFYRSS